MNIKNKAALILVVPTILLLYGCGCKEESSAPTYRLYDNQSAVIWKDPETGCEYLSGNLSGADMTPRLGRDGKQICR